MATEVLRPDWKAIGRSVRGFSHLRRSMPNQDSIGWKLSDSGLVLAISDGHGSPRCFRSDRGASIAVLAAIHVMKVLLEMNASGVDLPAIDERLVERLPQDLVRLWTAEVMEDIQTAPLSDEELNALTNKCGSEAAESALKNPLAVYGATVIAVAATDAFIAYLQLGDGDIVTVSKDGEASRPLPGDERLFANETTSLCLLEAWKDFRCRLQPVHHRPPALVLVSTDGYSNSFRDDSGFMKVGPDILNIVRSEGLEQLDSELEKWLTMTSQRGSGDDITLGVVCNVNGIAETAGVGDGEPEADNPPVEADADSQTIAGAPSMAGTSAYELSAEGEEQ